MNHRELVEIGAKWLKVHHDGRCFSDGHYRCSHPVVLKEMRSADFSIPDVIGFCSDYSTVIECKISKQDYRADAKKSHRHSLREAGNYRYYLAPKGLICPNDIHNGWGLLETDGKNVFITITASYHCEPEVKVSEYKMLYSFARRKYDKLVKYCLNFDTLKGKGD